MRMLRRVMLMLGVAAVCAGGGSALFASSALAGGVDPGSGLLSAAVYNVTPYTWTLVAAQTPGTLGCSPTCWDTQPAQTIQGGGASIYRINSNAPEGGGICFGNYSYGFDAYFTYQVDVLGGPPEYATVAIWGAETHGICFGGDNHPGFAVYFTPAPPPSNYDPGASGGAAPGPQTSNPQLTYQHNVPFLFDQSFQIVGNYTVDASGSLGAPFVNILNSLCVDASNTSCSFTQAGPLTWGTGDPGSPFAATHCGSAGGQNNSFTVGYTATQSASLTVGGGVTVSAEFDLFDVVENSISVSVEASHQWTETGTLTRQSTVDIPPNDIAFLWVVPVVGKVTGTLVLSDGSATFTATNFSETRSGVAKDALTPAFDVLTKVRPMTAGELQSHCQSSLSSTLPGGSRAKAPVRLVPGHGVGRVSLGQTQAQVARELGPPSGKHFLVNPCQGLEARCYAVAGTGGRWSYRKLTVLFGPDLHVSGVIYRGARRSAKGVGVGSSLPVLRGGYPAASCSAHSRRMNCTLTGANAGRTVKTVFSFKKTSGGLFKCDRVLIYVIDPRGRQVPS
jgi:hypothetical protein